MSNGVEVRKRLRCGACDKRLGLYRVLFTDTDITLGLVRGPTPDFLWDGSGPEPDVYVTQLRGAFPWRRPVGVPSMMFFANRYKWRCGCGARPIHRGDELRQRWVPREGTERI